ncbi:MAG: FkbM family methyltransferase [Capsulimonas sp.]|uniref:FkbM family methyltransferase n=1 Tax=Capsulimonas sp. TaxID=2494211 RepID=UPI0032633ACC
MFSVLRSRVTRLIQYEIPLYSRYRRVMRQVNTEAGFFVEAGANDGLTQSITPYLQKRGWKGLLIEPIPDLAEACRKNRPGAFVEQCALVSPDFETETVAMTYANLMSVVAGAMKSPQADAEHIRLGEEVQSLKSYSLTVPARTLDSVLDQYQIARVDLLILDVEGYELSALQGLDYDRLAPRFILCEARFREEVDALLLSRYEAIDEIGDYDVLYRLRGQS